MLMVTVTQASPKSQTSIACWMSPPSLPTRAANPGFQLELRQDLDPKVGELDIFPQALTRVSPKIAGNACDMTD